jgi:oxygen-independent coproporphyrinogen-3 oxidase
MSGIYIHIPFCKKKCHYCNFFTLATKKYREEFTVALLKEISQRKSETRHAISSIYFGGGTPSLLSRKELDNIFEQILKNHTLEDNIEITLEANPDDLKKSYLEELNKTVVNRLSIGIQSFSDKDLLSLNRMHTGQEAIESVVNAQNTGFNNLSLDLIYGIPSSDLNIWEDNLMKIKKLNVDHLSAYSLTQEPKTVYDHLIKKGKAKPPDEERAIVEYEMLNAFLPQLKMEQYEISNYARNKRYAIHNTNYWKGRSYLGYGPSAHSFDSSSRRWNVAQLKPYIDSVEKGAVKFEQEKLSLADKWNEWIMTGLRTKWGINLNTPPYSFPDIWLWELQKSIESMKSGDLVIFENAVLKLSEKGKLFADGLASSLFVVDK